jgi:3-dehydroquinate synthetase
MLAFEFSVRRGLLPESHAERVERHFAAVGLPTSVAHLPAEIADPERLVHLIGQDKKVRQGRLTFILARDIGQAFIAPDIDAADVRAFLTQKLAKQ